MEPYGSRMSRRLPPLNGLRAFEAAARHLSFTLAAEELHVTQGAVSRSVKGLEDHLGVFLFQRLPRMLALTSEGKVLLAGVTEGLDRIAQAAAKVEARAHDLQVKVPPTFTIRWLMRRLIRFQTSRPDIRVRLNTGWEWVDFDRDDFDAGIVFGIGPWPGLRADPLFEERLTVLCAPAIARPAEVARRSGALHDPAPRFGTERMAHLAGTGRAAGPGRGPRQPDLRHPGSGDPGGGGRAWRDGRGPLAGPRRHRGRAASPYRSRRSRRGSAATSLSARSIWPTARR